MLKVNPPAALSAGFGRRTIEPAEVMAADLTGQAVVVVIATLQPYRVLKKLSSSQNILPPIPRISSTALDDGWIEVDEEKACVSFKLDIIKTQ